MIPGHLRETSPLETGKAPLSGRLKLAGTVLAGILMAAGMAQSQTLSWNLPYTRSPDYDYTKRYAPNLRQYLSTNPDFFKLRLQKAWTFWKANFMMSNGLVNHRRLVNNAVVGTNEAVSEGQGYGMILAVLLNDQPTFNKIFEAANSNLWDGGKKSYRWTWPNGSSGAATDADIDICVALVFADELVKANRWQNYSGAVSYNTRAMEIMRSIKTNMTASNYLLPGDTWGGDGINNLNPSYFATAWMKVFNAYQKEIDWKPVIDNCYAVLAKVPRYNVGQAPDWCNQNGQQSSQGGSKPEQGLGMLSDGIRTPYRIGMDALWFKDERAIAYCKNTKGTLTEYNNANYAMLAAQMAQYTKAGTTTTESRGSFDNMAMWMVAVLGSGDSTFMAKGTDSQLFARLIGNSETYLGTNELQDDKFYYKQSIAMLGFAALGGQFPNVQADSKTVNIRIVPKADRSGMNRLFGSAGSGWITTVGISGQPDFRDALGRTVLLTGK